MPVVYFLTNALPSADYCVFIVTTVCKIITMPGSIDALSVIEWCHCFRLVLFSPQTELLFAVLIDYIT